MNIVILGPQGSGKGTQAFALRSRLGLAHIASGDVLRAARASDTELGRAVRKYYDAGELVPDEITVQLILEAIEAHADSDNVLLDGFPRTVAQAEALDTALRARGERIELVINLVAPLDVVRERLASRWTCRTCGAVYNLLTMPPKIPGKCDLDGGELYQREDDNPEAIQRRLSIWERENSELLAYYADRTRVVDVDANRPPDAVTEDLVSVITAQPG
ncbi:MAG: nucleoside monophosphate kinase [Chloroflexota bacterium]|nr:nucleoside monophosphate kinase [Chloroflexota bacterium]